MSGPPSTVREGVSRFAAHAARTNVSFTAAGIAYYVQVSLLPALVLGFVVVSVVGGDALAARALAVTGDMLSPAGQSVVRDALTAAAGRTEASLGSLFVLG